MAGIIVRVFGTVAVACLLMGGGCSQKFTVATARRNMSPKLETMTATHEQRLNAYARTVDVNLRQLNDDIDELLLLDRPMLTTRTPVP